MGLHTIWGGKSNGEACAAHGGVINDDGTTEAVDNAAYEGEAVAAGQSAGGPFGGLCEVKDAWTELWRNTGAVILNDEDGSVGRLLKLHHDGAAGPGRLDRVVNEIADDRDAIFAADVTRLFRGERIDVVIVAVGLFALGEALYVASRLRNGEIPLIPITKGWRTWMRRSDWKRSWKPWLRGTAIGFPIGTIPAGGADVATFLSYATERSLAKPKYKKQFGKGAIEGVAGPEAANNAAAAGVLVPLLTLGIPTTATAAMMLYAFTSYNIAPGPRLFETQPVLV